MPGGTLPTSSKPISPARPRKEGRAEVARWVALDPDGETSIYRKFGELNARALLHKQCRPAVLEKQLQQLDEQDASSADMELKDAARTWETLVWHFAAGDESARIRPELTERIEAALKDYCQLI